MTHKRHGTGDWMGQNWCDDCNEEKPMKVYLSGPMRGYEDYNFPAFHQTAGRLRSYGHEVHCPAEDSLRLAEEKGKSLDDISFEEFMHHDIKAVVDADIVAVLPGWKDSIGARTEVFIATVLGKDVVDAENWELLRGFSLTLALDAFVGKGTL